MGDLYIEVKALESVVARLTSGCLFILRVEEELATEVAFADRLVVMEDKTFAAGQYDILGNLNAKGASSTQEDVSFRLLLNGFFTHSANVTGPSILHSFILDIDVFAEALFALGGINKRIFLITDINII
jgi:hypothetical protein